LVNLVRLIERNPHVGIVQAPPLPVNGRTLFSRLHQFAAQAYNSVFITGLNFWQGGAANYWGHNAIIRIRPFVEHCRLPTLSGKEPLGGSILSHDFVEAALMRRAGWRVYLASELHGTYEELPPSLISYAVRDRRWCQGNLQHARLLFTPGLHLVNRIHLWMGVMAYVSAPLWILALVLATIQGLTETLGKHHYFSRQQTLFPTWHISIQHRATLLFLGVMALLLLPKFFSLIPCLLNRERAAAFGGRLKLSLSVLLEIIFSALTAPILAAERTRFVAAILLGRNVKWQTQQRDDLRTSLGEALSRHAAATGLGLVWSGLFLFAAPRLFWCFSPILAGLILAIPLSVWSSRATAGAWARRRGLWLIPEEITPLNSCIGSRRNSKMPTPVAGRRRGMVWLGCSRTLASSWSILPCCHPSAPPMTRCDSTALRGSESKSVITVPMPSLPRNDGNSCWTPIRSFRKSSSRLVCHRNMAGSPTSALPTKTAPDSTTRLRAWTSPKKRPVDRRCAVPEISRLATNSPPTSAASKRNNSGQWKRWPTGITKCAAVKLPLMYADE
ncbi:MAG: glucans biosynthesis glucosyltransferase MdoH, partial [Verrucomicrobia bacterium]|nr:glucans biosynthesis glucosyltransferase MdoH [Verrucomicrobiota bacterium]